jgi:hypothetical protein
MRRRKFTCSLSFTFDGDFHEFNKPTSKTSPTVISFTYCIRNLWTNSTPTWVDQAENPASAWRTWYCKIGKIRSGYMYKIDKHKIPYGTYVLAN